jgi:ligand-binding sensor domain-containing protein
LDAGLTGVTLAVDDAADGAILVGTDGHGVLRSIDGGAHWLATTLNWGWVRAVTLDSHTGLIAYAAIDDRIAKSQDRGATWTLAARLGSRLNSLVSTAEGLFAATAAGLMKSSDGVVWSHAGLDDVAVQDICAADAGRKLVAASGAGVFMSVDGAQVWTLAPVGAVTSVAATRSLTLAGTFRGVLRRDRASNWTESNSGLPARAVFAVLKRGDGSLYAATDSGVLAEREGVWEPVPGTADRATYSLSAVGGGELLIGTSRGIGRQMGANWSWIDTSGAFAVVRAASPPNRAYGATRTGVLLSSDGGLNWAKANSGLEHLLPVALAASGRSPTLYAGTAGGGVYRSTDGAQKWKRVGTELSHTLIRCLSIDPSDDDVVYAGTDRGPYVSTNGGRSWSARFEGLPRTPVYSILDVSGPAEPAVIAGTGAGVFVTHDRGKTWTELAPGTSVGIPVALGRDSATGRILVGTYGAGILILDQPASGSGRREKDPAGAPRSGARP